jgi:hypothetical protein
MDNFLRIGHLNVSIGGQSFSDINLSPRVMGVMQLPAAKPYWRIHLRQAFLREIQVSFGS